MKIVNWISAKLQSSFNGQSLGETVVLINNGLINLTHEKAGEALDRVICFLERKHTANNKPNK